MSRDADLQRERVALFAEALRDRMSAGRGPGYEAIVAMIGELPEKQSAAMRLVFVEGLSIRKASRRLERHHSTVAGLIAAGTIKLGAMLTQCGARRFVER